MEIKSNNESQIKGELELSSSIPDQLSRYYSTSFSDENLSRKSSYKKDSQLNTQLSNKSEIIMDSTVAVQSTDSSSDDSFEGFDQLVHSVTNDSFADSLKDVFESQVNIDEKINPKTINTNSDLKDDYLSDISLFSTKSNSVGSRKSSINEHLFDCAETNNLTKTNHLSNTSIQSDQNQAFETKSDSFNLNDSSLYIFPEKSQSEQIHVGKSSLVSSNSDDLFKDPKRRSTESIKYFFGSVLKRNSKGQKRVSNPEDSSIFYKNKLPPSNMKPSTKKTLSIPIHAEVKSSYTCEEYSDILKNHIVKTGTEIDCQKADRGSQDYYVDLLLKKDKNENLNVSLNPKQERRKKSFLHL